jgi:predicted metalloprotease with PDZ domain
MRTLSFAAAVAVAAFVPAALTAQTVRVFSNESGDRAALGVSTASGSLRDTIGVLISDVTVGGPADKAGIQEGDRIASIGDIDLRLAAADAAAGEMRGIMARRLAHALAKHAVGDVVDLRVYHDGQFVSRKVTTGKASEVFVMPAVSIGNSDGESWSGLLGAQREQLNLQREQLERSLEQLRRERPMLRDSTRLEMRIDNGPHRI